MIRKSLLTVITLCIMILFTAAPAASGPPAPGDDFPNIPLKMPENREYRDYLGLKGGKTFSMGDIKARVVIVEVLSMYCPHCQREAPRVNELFRMIEDDASSRGRVKLIGIAAGNSAFEADIFRKKYGIPFPLIDDGDFTLHKALGEVRTPYFFGVVVGEGAPRVVHSKLGGFENPKEFLSEIMKNAGL